MKKFTKVEKFRKVILQEVEALSTLNHPNIIKMVSCAFSQEQDESPYYYILLEKARNGTMFDFIAQAGKFSEPIARHYFRQLLSGIDYLHSAGYAHRDLKSENLLLDEDYNLKICDFGFSGQAHGPDGPQLFSEQQGTVGYAAPEIYTGTPYCGKKADLFAAGVILFTLVAGRRPFYNAE